MSSLRLLNETTATSVATVTVENVFTSDYDIYKVQLLRPDLNTGTGTWLDIRLVNTSGSVISTSSYKYASYVFNSDSGFGEDKSQSANYIRGLRYSSNSSADGGGMDIYVFNPINSAYTFLIQQSNSFSTAESKMVGTNMIGVLESNMSIGGIFFTNGGNNFDSVNIKVYGLRVDS